MTVLNAVHMAMAILSGWRITELVTQDQVFAPLRKRWTHYFWTCGRCVSVWAGGLATILYLAFPWANWPFGISMTFLLMGMITTLVAQSKHQRKITVFPDQQRVDWGGFNERFVVTALRQAASSVEQSRGGKAG